METPMTLPFFRFAEISAKKTAFVMAALVFAAAVFGPATARATDVNFITDFGFNGRHSYFYVALDKGYYQAEGLNVTILRGQGSIDAIKKVASGAATIGFADAGALVLARSNDAIPVKLLMIMYASPPHAIFATADSGIKTPKDLEGRTVADSAFSAIPLVFKAYAKATGIDADKVKWISAESSSLPSLLATGRVDAIGQFTVGQPLLEAAVKPKELVRFAYKDAGLDYYGNGLVATEETIKNDPETLKKFVRATIKGMRDAFADPAQAAEILHKYHKEITPEVGQGETVLVKELAEVKGQPLGAIDPTRIERTIEVMKESYPMKTPVDAKDMFVPGFVE
jgi:NitT/TauT family transport system substrate-binding protein